MMIGLRKMRMGAGLFAILALAGCASGPKPLAPAPVVQPASAAEIEEIAALLDRGEVRSAKRRIEKGLERDPMNASLQVLLQGIEGDARSDLGPNSFAYVVRPGDTMAGLAERFLGNRLKSYQLARYNGIDEPDDLQAGIELRIPGQAPRPETAPRTSAPRAADKPAPAARPKAEAEKPARSETAPPAQKTADPAAARKARAAGLVALNQGKVAQAVTLLRRAAALEPGNKAIAADLARAERIAATVRSRQ